MPPHASVARRPDMLTLDEAAIYLGTTVSWLAATLPGKGGPPLLKVGRTVYYLRQDLDAWLEAQRIASTCLTPTSLPQLRPASASTGAPAPNSGGSTSDCPMDAATARARAREIAVKLRTSPTKSASRRSPPPLTMLSGGKPATPSTSPSSVGST